MTRDDIKSTPQWATIRGWFYSAEDAQEEKSGVVVQHGYV